METVKVVENLNELDNVEIEKEDIESFYKRRLQSSEINIGEEYFDNEKLNNLLLNNNKITTLWLRTGEQTLSNENKKLLKEKLINCYLNGQIISSSHIFGYHTLEDVQKKENFKISFFKEEYLDHLKYVKNELEISNIDDSHDIDKNIELYQKLIEKLEELNIKSTVTIDETIIKNIKLKESQIPYKNLKNVTLKIYRDGLYYTQEEYLEEDKKLDNLISDIKNSEFSPFEKYLAVYNKVKQFKPYKENYSNYINYLIENGMNEKEALEFMNDPKNKAFYNKWSSENILVDKGRDQSRHLKYILDNEYMVCVGYSHLLKDLLERVGIESSSLGVNVDLSYGNGFTVEEKPVEFGGHARNLINLVDEQYGISGYYVSDPTWDNNIELDLYSHAIMTMEETSRERAFQQTNEYDYLLNVHNMKEFNEKLNVFIDKEYNKQLIQEKQNKQDSYSMEKLINIFASDEPVEEQNPYREELNKKEVILKKALNNISLTMANIFKKIDYNEYLEFYKQYSLLERKRNRRQDTPQDYYDLFTIFGNYILTKTNKQISGNSILIAATVVRSFDEKNKGKPLKQLFNEIREIQTKSQAYHFPKREIYSDNLGVIIENETNKFQNKNK